MLTGNILSAKTARQRGINPNWEWQDVFADHTRAHVSMLFDPGGQ